MLNGSLGAAYELIYQTGAATGVGVQPPPVAACKNDVKFQNGAMRYPSYIGHSLSLRPKLTIYYS